jgi:hypothetical protein
MTQLVREWWKIVLTGLGRNSGGRGGDLERSVSIPTDSTETVFRSFLDLHTYVKIVS